MLAGRALCFLENTEQIVDHISIPSDPVKQQKLLQMICQNLRGVIIVEKDTVFQRILTSKWFERYENDTLLVTAKGYPDYSTKQFLDNLLRLESHCSIPIVYIGDADPFGTDIYF